MCANRWSEQWVRSELCDQGGRLERRAAGGRTSLAVCSLSALALGALFSVASASSVEAQSISASETDPRKIADAVEVREDGDKQFSRMKMTVIDRSGRKLERTVQSRAMDFEGGTRTLMLFESPADVRNTGLLSIDYDSAKKDDDQWLYLPSLRRSTRISTADRSGSFLGTDISYSDMTARDTSAYDYKLVEASADVDGEDCWVIESRPRTEKERKETGYVKSRTWISKSKLMPLKVKAWVKEGRKLKYMKFGKLEQIDGIWVAQKITVRVVKAGETQSTTTLEMSSVAFDSEKVKEDDFTQRRLETGI